MQRGREVRRVQADFALADQAAAALVRAADLLLDEAVLHRGVRRPKRGSLRRPSPIAFDPTESS